MRKLLGLGLLLTFSFSAYAYIPPAPFILHTIAKKHTGFSSLKVTSTIYSLDSNGMLNSPKLRETTLYFAQSQTLKSSIVDESSGKTLYSSQRKILTEKVPPLVEILFDTNSVRISNALRAAGIQFPKGKGDSEGVPLTLKRWNRSVAWVFGNASQLWVEKDTFFPMRLIVPAVGESDLLDVDMEGYKSFDDYAYPRMMTVFENGKKIPLMKAELTDVTVDPEISAAQAPQEKAEGLTEAGASAPAAVRGLIQMYYRLIR